MRRHRSLISLAGVVTGLSLGGMSLAFACSPQYTISMRPSSAPAGTSVSLSGVGFKDGLVEIRWQTGSGAVLATVTAARSFTTSVTIPDAPPGVHYVVAQTADGAFASTAFEVTGAKASAPVSPPVELATPTPPPAAPSAAPASLSPAPAPVPPPAAVPTPATAAATAPAVGPSAARQPARGPAPALAEVVPPPASVAAPAESAAAAEAPPADLSVPQVASPLTDAPAAPSPGSASDDLWSAFGSGALPSPAPGSGQPTSRTAPAGGASAAGMVLLFGGLAMVMTGVGLSVLRRRRAVPASPAGR